MRASVSHFRWHLTDTLIISVCERDTKNRGSVPPSAPLLRRWHTSTSKLNCSLLVWQSEAVGLVQTLLLTFNYTFWDIFIFISRRNVIIKANKAPHANPHPPSAAQMRVKAPDLSAFHNFIAMQFLSTNTWYIWYSHISPREQEPGFNDEVSVSFKGKPKVPQCLD